MAWGLRRLLNWIKEEYGNPPIYIIENGVGIKTKSDVDDNARIFYYKTYIDEALKGTRIFFCSVGVVCLLSRFLVTLVL